MKIITTVSRILLGLIFVVFGSNAFLHFLNPPPPQGLAGDFVKVLFVSHYFYAVAVLQITGGLLCLAGRFVPLGLTLLGPVIVNILLFHIFIEPGGALPAVVVSVLALVVLIGNRSAFAGLIKP